MHKPACLALSRQASTHAVPPGEQINTKREEKIAEKPIEPDPGAVSIDSSVRHMFHEEGVEEQEPDTDMLAGVKSDLV